MVFWSVIRREQSERRHDFCRCTCIFISLLIMLCLSFLFYIGGTVYSIHAGCAPFNCTRVLSQHLSYGNYAHMKPNCSVIVMNRQPIVCNMNCSLSETDVINFANVSWTCYTTYGDSNLNYYTCSSVTCDNNTRSIFWQIYLILLVIFSSLAVICWIFLLFIEIYYCIRPQRGTYERIADAWEI